ncbi:septum formation family protein [Streptomyces glomeratus]|uniref:septum formation family protein n=1 Tax=Streptomyces glomeratus TaxID=284452 RepID=UPI001F2437B7|nr:septum formation family protein [Streptomyces glomeratus]MCF1508171.1 septum formation family protein [Streptomyces glomeratus]
MAAGLLGASLQGPSDPGHLPDGTDGVPLPDSRAATAPAGSATVSPRGSYDDEAGDQAPPFVPVLLRGPGPGNGKELSSPGLEPPDARRRTGSHVLWAALAGAYAVVVVVVGVWISLDRVQSREPGPASPGSVISVTERLEVGDCVLVEWAGPRFEGTPHLTVDRPCAARAPDGQVIAVVGARTADEARWRGPLQCERRTEELRDRLADVSSYAVVPTRETFDVAGRRTACLVLGAHGPVYGPLGPGRTSGYAFTDTANMQMGDCLRVQSNRAARLISCSRPHDQEVLGFTRLGADVTLTEAKSRSDAACARDVPPAGHGFDPAVYEPASWTAQGAWKSGTHVVVCAVRRQNGATMRGNESGDLRTAESPPSL